MPGGVQSAIKPSIRVALMKEYSDIKETNRYGSLTPDILLFYLRPRENANGMGDMQGRWG
jgi:hypothetical protein